MHLPLLWSSSNASSTIMVIYRKVNVVIVLWYNPFISSYVIQQFAISRTQLRKIPKTQFLYLSKSALIYQNTLFPLGKKIVNKFKKTPTRLQAFMTTSSRRRLQPQTMAKLQLSPSDRNLVASCFLLAVIHSHLAMILQRPQTPLWAHYCQCSWSQNQWPWFIFLCHFLY